MRSTNVSSECASGSAAAATSAATNAHSSSNKTKQLMFEVDRQYRVRSNTDGELNASSHAADILDIELPPLFKNRLYELFGAIEKEFEAIYAENVALHSRVEALTEKLTEGGAIAPEKAAEILNLEMSAGKKKAGGSQVGQRLKTALKVPPGRLVQTFKVGNDASRVRFVRTYDGHTDGVWHVSALQCYMLSASADSTARVWNIHNAHCLAQYVGHASGCSVNTVVMRPAADNTDTRICLTSSGDQSAHIWKVVLPIITPPSASTAPTQSSEDELEPVEREQQETELDEQLVTVRQPSLRLTGHTAVVIAADWLCGGEQVVTASWDRTANIYDAEKGEILNILSGHDQELTYCHAHPTQKLVVTSSKDSTFRLWDFRDAIHSVAVFQGHADCVNSAILCGQDKVVSASEDRCVKVWDLRNMRSATATLRLDSPANRVAVSRNGTIAIPHDNRHVRLYDLNGIRFARLPRANRRCHRRMVCSTAWAEDAFAPACPTTASSSSSSRASTSTLLTAGFDKMIINWQTTVPCADRNKD